MPGTKNACDKERNWWSVAQTYHKLFQSLFPTRLFHDIFQLFQERILFIAGGFLLLGVGSIAHGVVGIGGEKGSQTS